MRISEPGENWSGEWGIANCKKWDILPVGRILVVRMDKKSLYPFDVEALAYYSRYELYLAMQREGSMADQDHSMDWDVGQARTDFIKTHMC